MAFRYRRWRTPWWRRWRNKFRFGRRRYRKRRRWPRRRYRRRTFTVRQNIPRKRKTVTCQGWEILGIIGSNIRYKWNTDDTGRPANAVVDISDLVATDKRVTYFDKIYPKPYNNDKCDSWLEGADYYDFCGGWGYAGFTIHGLALRALLGMCRFSDTILGYPYIRLKHMAIELMRGNHVNYLFRPDPDYGENITDPNLIHPAWMILFPFTKQVDCIQRTHCCRNVRVRIRPPAQLGGWWEFDQFLKQYLFGYDWSVWDPVNPLGKNPQPEKNAKTVFVNEWMKDGWKTDQTDISGQKLVDTRTWNWQKRATYNTKWVDWVAKNTGQEEGSWWDTIFNNQPGTLDNASRGKHSPFLPPIIPAPKPETLWFKYKIVFQLGGSSYGRRHPVFPIREEEDWNSECRQNGPKGCEACIQPGDLDDTGFIKEKSLKRIINAPKRHKAHRPYRVKKSFVEKLTHFILSYRRKRKKVRWADEHPKETSEPHSHPPYRSPRFK
nr:MAG: ORF1 [Torque teno polar bear virus 43]